MNIGAIIKEKRQKKDLTQEQLAEYLNVSVSSASCDPYRFTKNHTETHTEIVLKRIQHKEFDFLYGYPEFEELLKRCQTA